MDVLIFLGLEALFFQLTDDAYETVILTCVTCVTLYYIYAYCISDFIEHLEQVSQRNLSCIDAKGDPKELYYIKVKWEQYERDRHGWWAASAFGRRFVVVLLDIVLGFIIQFAIFFLIHWLMMLFVGETDGDALFRIGTIIYLIVRIPFRKWIGRIVKNAVA